MEKGLVGVVGEVEDRSRANAKPFFHLPWRGSIFNFSLMSLQTCY